MEKLLKSPHNVKLMHHMGQRHGPQFQEVLLVSRGLALVSLVLLMSTNSLRTVGEL